MIEANGDDVLPELPEGWERKKVSDVATVVRGVSYKKDQTFSEPRDGYIPLLRSGNVREELDLGRNLVYVPEEVVRDDQRLRAGDIVVSVSNSRELVGKAAPLREAWEGTFGAFLGVVRPIAAAVNPAYLATFFGSPGYRREIMSRSAATSNIANVRKGHLLDLDIALPPLEQQGLVAERVKSLISVCDEGDTELDAASTALRRYRRSLLRRAFDGVATAPLAEIAELRSGLTKGRKTREPTMEIAFLRAANVRDGALDLTEIKTIPATDRERERFKLEPGDVLMVEGSGSPGRLGQGWVWEGQVDSSLHQNHVFCARPDAERCLPRYLAWFIQSPAARAYFRTVAKTTSGLATMNKRELSALPVPLPAEDEQLELVDQLDRMAFELANTEAVIAKGARRSRALHSAVMSAAVAGRLL